MIIPLTINSFSAKKILTQSIQKLRSLGVTVNSIRRLSPQNFELVVDGTYTHQQTVQFQGYVDDLVLADKNAGIEEGDSLGIRNLTNQQIEAYIDANVTDLASAKNLLKKLAQLELWLYKQVTRNE